MPEIIEKQNSINYNILSLKELETNYSTLKEEFIVAKKEWDKSKKKPTKDVLTSELTQTLELLEDLKSRIDELKSFKEMPTKDLNELFNIQKIEFQKGMAKLNADSLTSTEESLELDRSKLIKMNDAINRLKSALKDKTGGYIQMSKTTKFAYKKYLNG